MKTSCSNLFQSLSLCGLRKLSKKWSESLGFVTFLIPCLLVISLPALARDLVIDLENVLVQQIPFAQYRAFAKKDQMFQVELDDRILSFYINDQGREWIKHLLSRDDITLSLTSDRKASITDSMLTNIDKDLKKKILEKKGRVLTAENMEKGLHNLELVSSDLKELVYITHLPKKIAPAQQARVFDFGPSFYRFETWESSKTAAASVPSDAKHFYAPSEELWKRDVVKVPILANIFKQKNYGLDVRALKSLGQKDLDKQAKAGTAILSGKSTVTTWTSSGKVLSGCGDLDLLTEKVSALPWNKCLEILPHTIEWKVSKDRSKAESCTVKVQEENATADLPVDTCLSEKLPKFWRGKTKNDCSYYTSDLVYIAPAPVGDCESKHVLKEPKTNKYVSVDYFEGMEKLELKDIFTRLFDRPMSFRKDLMDGSIGPFEEQLPGGCLRAIQSVYNSGKDFSLQIIKDRITTLRKLKYRSGQNDLVFYHYTNSAPVSEIARNNRFLEFFKFYRTKRQAWWLDLFYVAEDPESSASYGNIQVKVHMKAETRALSEFADPDAPQFRYKVINEITSKYPSINVCITGDNFNDLNIYYLAADDSGVDIIQYWNAIDTSYYYHPNEYQFFQILNPGAIERVEQGVAGQW